MYIFVFKACLYLKCSKTHLQASLFPKFSQGDTLGSSVKRGMGSKEEGKGRVKERRRLRHGCRGMDAPQLNCEQTDNRY